MYSKILTPKSIGTCSKQISLLRQKLDSADAVIIGAGAGLSTSAGFSYTGERFTEHFTDFIAEYQIADMYSGGFYPFATPEERWAWWSRHIYWNRYVDAPKPVYHHLLKLVKNKDYFVLTTNVDHQFQKTGFDKKRLFYTQGDYGLFQCSKPCCQKTYDNEAIIGQMLAEQKNMRIPSELVPHCPACGKPLTMNLRADNSFVQDEGWYAACQRYEDFIRCHKHTAILYLELGVGMNTPGIIKYSFWQQAYQNPNAIYACINQNEAFAPAELKAQALCIEADIGAVLCSIMNKDDKQLFTA